MGLEDAEILSQGLVPSCKERKASVEKTSKKPSRLFLDTWLQPTATLMPLHPTWTTLESPFLPPLTLGTTEFTQR